jgi:hypothetical protein
MPPIRSKKLLPIPFIGNFSTHFLCLTAKIGCFDLLPPYLMQTRPYVEEERLVPVLKVLRFRREQLFGSLQILSS